MKSHRFTLLLCALTFAAGGMHAQIAVPTAGDAAWQSLQSIIQTDGESPSAATLITEADGYKAFYSQYPNHTQARNARCLEALALVKAWLQGDTSQATRRAALVASVRTDKSVSAPLRAQLFAFSDSVGIEKQSWTSRDDKMAAYAQATRALIAEFPEMPNGYESLMYIARDSSDTAGPALAKEVLSMSAAPAWVRSAAQVIADRFALIGQSLPGIATPMLGAGSPFASASGHSIVVYSWATSNPASVLRAKATAAKAPAGAVVVGVCLDSGDASSAKAQAAAQALPGTQLYDSLGVKGALAQALKFTSPGFIYLAGTDGVIRSVSLQDDLVSTC